MKIDLHMHTYYSSDADYSPIELAQLAQKNDLDVISIADHDTVTGVQETEQACEKYGIRVIPNVEISTSYMGIDLHILGFHIDINNPLLKTTLEKIRGWDLERVSKYVDILKDNFGFQVSMDDVQNLTPRGVPKLALLAKAIMQNPANMQDKRLIPYYRGNKSSQPYHNFFLDFLKHGKPAYVEPVNSFDSVQAINIIIQSGGIPVLAHPGGSIPIDQRKNVIKNLTNYGLAGLEVYSSYHTSKDEKWLLNTAKDLELLVTAGSDFHGPTVKPEIKMGDFKINSIDIIGHLDWFKEKMHAS